jgi:hypothetical protein
MEQKRTWAQLLSSASDVPDVEYLMVDGSIVRPPPARRGKKNRQDHEAMGKSRGGLSTKIHAAVDALHPRGIKATPCGCC